MGRVTLNMLARDHTRRTDEKNGGRLTRTFFFLQSSQAFMILIKCACSLCSFVLVPRPAELVTSMPSLVMMENPGNLISAVLGVTFLDFFSIRRLPFMGDLALNEPYPESARVAEEAGEGLKSDCEVEGLSSKSKAAPTQGDTTTLNWRVRAPVFRSTVAWLKNSMETSASLSFLEPGPTM
jgi:hypothetical protein